MPPSPITPKFDQKFDRGGQKIGKEKFLGHFHEQADSTSGQNIPNPKNRLPKSFFLSKVQELEVRNCAQPNSPIIIMILLNRFHEFAISMGLNTSDKTQ